MQRLIVYTLLAFYLFSFARPFVPEIIQSVSEYFWEAAHKKEIGNMNGRTNILVELKKMADHNSSRSNDYPMPDLLKSPSGFALSILADPVCIFSDYNFIENYFSFNSDIFNSNFQKSASPPPKAV